MLESPMQGFHRIRRLPIGLGWFKQHLKITRLLVALYQAMKEWLNLRVFYLRVMLNTANFEVKFRNHGEGQSVPSFRRGHRDSGKAVVDHSLDQRKLPNVLKVATIDDEPLKKPRLKKRTHRDYLSLTTPFQFFTTYKRTIGNVKNTKLKWSYQNKVLMGLFLGYFMFLGRPI
jgi:hypothetical protein